jgi:hypothetical protein
MTLPVKWEKRHDKKKQAMDRQTVALLKQRTRSLELEKSICVL